MLPLLLLVALLPVAPLMQAHADADAAHAAGAASGRSAEEGRPSLKLHMYTPLCEGTEDTCAWSGGKTMNVGVQLMVQHINSGGYLRGNWTLDVKLFDTACSPENGRDEATRLLLLPREERPFAVIGCGCSGCTRSAHPLLNLARVPLVSQSSSSPILSNRIKYPNFFRLCVPDQEGMRTLLRMFRGLNWTIHAQVYDTLYGEFMVSYVRQMTEDLGMVNVFAGRSIAKMREASLTDAQPVVEALVLARTRAILYMGYEAALWYLGCSMFKRDIRGMVVAHMGWYQADWWRMQPDPSPCTTAEMDIAVNHWTAARDPIFADLSTEVECLPRGVGLKAFVEAYERSELGAVGETFVAAAADTVCFLAKIFNTLLDMGFTADEVHNMNESTYETYSAVAQGTSIMGTSGPISFPSDPTTLGGGDRINVGWVDQLQDAAYVSVAKIDGQDIVFGGSESTMSFFGRHSLANPPAARFPACPHGVYNFTSERCEEGCPFGSNFIETEGSCFCSPGFRANGSECSPCTEGSFSASFGSEKCELCDIGMFAHNRGQTSCERCPLGTFMPRKGAAACEPCGLRRTTLERGADAAALCVCEGGSYLRNDSATCETCSEGLLCTAGRGPPQLKPGYWAELRELTHEHVVWRCRNAHECQGGAIGQCAAGRQGRCCNDCLALHRPLDDGTCKPCESWDIVPAVVVSIVVLALLIALLVLVRVDASRENLELVGITIMATQLCMVLQMLGAFAQIQVPWVNPAKAILEQLRFLSLDLDFVNGNCWLPSADPVSKFAFQLLAFPSWACAVLLARLASQFTCKPLSFTEVFCLLGTVLFMVFIVLTLTVLLPFQCKSNPSGRTSMAAHPGMVCFESEEHWTLVVMASVGFMVYPATCLTWVSRATVSYPAWISSGRGFRLVRKYRFLFGRFKPEHYYFGLCVLYRNALIALLPIVLVSAEAAQMLILCVLLACSGLFVAHVQPWRTPITNLADVLMLFCTVLLLTGMAMLVEVTDATQRSVGWLLCVLLLLPLALGLTCIAWGSWKNFHRRLHYEVFLSHHKAGAGVLARFLKLELTKVGVVNTFLDVDSLENLDTLFFIVRRQTQNMVVLLSSETLKRMWCAGEIVTAHMNNVHTVPVLCDGFVHPDEVELGAIVRTWTSADLQALAAQGISWDMTKAAYGWLQRLPCVELCRFSSEAEHSQHIHSILQLCSHAKAAPQPKPPTVSRPEILITGAVSDPEALAACHVFRIMVQQTMRVETAVVRTSRELQRARGTASFLIVLLVRGVLFDERFAEIMIDHRRTCRPLTLVTVNADPGFKFPSRLTYNSLRQNGPGGSDAETLICAYQSLLRVLALPFSPLGSVNLLQNEIAEICRRRLATLDSRFRRRVSPKVLCFPHRAKSGAPPLGEEENEPAVQEQDSVPKEAVPQALPVKRKMVAAHLSPLCKRVRWMDKLAAAVEKQNSAPTEPEYDSVPEEVAAPAPRAPPVRHKTTPLHTRL